MTVTLLLLAAALLCAANAVSYQDITALAAFDVCKTVFNTSFVTATTATARCQAIHNLFLCHANARALATEDGAVMFRNIAASFLDAALAVSTTCNLAEG